MPAGRPFRGRGGSRGPQHKHEVAAKPGAENAEKSAEAQEVSGEPAKPAGNFRPVGLVVLAPGNHPELPATPLVENEIAEQDNSSIRRLGNWPAQKTYQTLPPTIPVHMIYGSEDSPLYEASYPVGDIVEYVGQNGYRMSSEEKKLMEKDYEAIYKNVRRAAEAHRQTRKYFQSIVKPEMSMIELAQRLEQKSLEMISSTGLESGFAFPTGLSLNNCAAHYTPNYGDTTVLKQSDIMKVDFGIHVDGYLVDCAFTVAFDSKFDELIHATQDGTNTGLKNAGIDARFTEIGAAIQEAIESYEFTPPGGKSIPIKAIQNLNGHTVDQYRIHAGKSLPIVKNNCPDKMEECEIYAVETFASTGKGHVMDEGECSHYMLNYDYAQCPPNSKPIPRLASARPLIELIEKKFKTLAFCRRWLDDSGSSRQLLALRSLCDNDIVVPYPPLSDSFGSFTSQMEHTVMLRPTCKEIVSRGPDY